MLVILVAWFTSKSLHSNHTFMLLVKLHCLYFTCNNLIIFSAFKKLIDVKEMYACVQIHVHSYEIAFIKADIFDIQWVTLWGRLIKII